MATLAVFSFSRIFREHRRSIPSRSRNAVALIAWGLPFACAVPFITGVVDMGPGSALGLAGAAFAFAALVFGLAVRLFEMAADTRPQEDPLARRAAIERARLVRQMLATVTVVTLNAAGAGIMAVATAFGEAWTTGNRVTAAFAVVLLGHSLALGAIVLRRTYDFGDRLLSVALDEPTDLTL